MRGKQLPFLVVLLGGVMDAQAARVNMAEVERLSMNVGGCTGSLVKSCSQFDSDEKLCTKHYHLSEGKYYTCAWTNWGVGKKTCKREATAEYYCGEPNQQYNYRNIAAWWPAVRDQISSCRGGKWTGLLHEARDLSLSPENVATIIADQVEERIRLQGLPINQGSEGVCGPVALEYIMTIVDPYQFASVVRDLWCTGNAVIGPGQNRTKIPAKTYACRVSSGAEKDSGRQLFHLQTANEDKIRAADWLFVAGLEETTNDFFSICESRSGQTQTPVGEKQMADLLFGAASVDLYGGLGQHVGKSIVNALAMAVTVGCKRGMNRYLGAEDWQKVMQSVRTGSHAAVTIDTKAGKELDGLMCGNHFAVLTAVLGEEYGTTACAKEMLRRKPACVMWTWAQYFVWESCENLWKVVPDAVVVNYRERSIPLATPEVWKPTGSWQDEISDTLRDFNHERISGTFRDEQPNWYARKVDYGGFNFIPRIFYDGEDRTPVSPC